jgi:hypothetical protein
MVDDVANYEGTHNGQTGPAPDGVWRVVSWRSTDGGTTFEPAAVAGELAIPRRVVVDLGPAPSFARSRSGPMYATWDGGRGDSRDVFLSSSADGGRSWTPPRTVAGGRGAQFLPAVAVAPDGRVDIVFYDRGRDRGDVRSDVVVQSSWDGGRSFVRSVASDASSDTRIATSGFSGITELGTQSALVAQPDRALAVWTDTRRATPDNVAQDLASAQVDVSRAEKPRSLLVGLGVGLLVGGAVIGARRPRRSSARGEASHRS